jgi:hypothetical protein
VSLHADKDNPAQDITGANLLAVAQFLASNYGTNIRELIYTPLGFGIKDGQRVGLDFWGPEINAMHYSHVHVADKGGVFKGPGLVQIGAIKETVFQPAQKVSELPQSEAKDEVWGRAFPALAFEVKGLGKAVKTAFSGLTKELRKQAPLEVNRSTESLTQMFESRSTSIVDNAQHVRLADKGGVFQGPGLVGVGGIKETVFQPARKVGELPQNGQMVARFKGPVKVDLVNGEAYFEEILLEHDKYQAYRGRAY